MQNHNSDAEAKFIIDIQTKYFRSIQDSPVLDRYTYSRTKKKATEKRNEKLIICYRCKVFEMYEYSQAYNGDDGSKNYSSGYCKPS